MEDFGLFDENKAGVFYVVLRNPDESDFDVVWAEVEVG